MPLYEFYCEPCHAIFSFRSLRVDTSTVPACPVCGKMLVREVSAFAPIMKGKNSAEPTNEGEAVSRMDQVMGQLGERLQALDDEDADPREAVKVMRELASAGGMTFNKEVQEAMARIEAGEDPAKIDEEFSEIFDTDNPFTDGDNENTAGAKTRACWRRLRPPKRDPKWYDLNPRGTTG